MKSYLFAALLGSSLLGLPFVVGCDSGKTTTEKTTETTHANGTTSTDSSKSTTDANGNSKTTTEHTNTP